MNSRARYEIKELPLMHGACIAETTVIWSRVYGRCNRQDHTRTNTLHTQKQLIRWGKRNNIEIKPTDLGMLPDD